LFFVQISSAPLGLADLSHVNPAINRWAGLWSIVPGGLGQRTSLQILAALAVPAASTAAFR